MTDIIIFHNPRCSKSRQALQLLEEKKLNYKKFLYLEETITHDNFVKVLKLLKVSPREAIRTKEKEYKENNLDDQTLSDFDLIEVMLKYRKLIERPIIINGGKAIIARPPEKLLEII